MMNLMIFINLYLGMTPNDRENCDIYMNNRNIGGCSRLQATDGSPMVIAAGDGHTTGNEYVDLLGDYVQ